MNPVYHLRRGEGPLLVSMPHDGIKIPDDVVGRMTATALKLPDTDWHVSRLYDFLVDTPVTTLSARYSRYLIDLNRPADGKALYPGQDETGLCPTTQFDSQPIYCPGMEPDPAETSRRVESYWRPYHQALTDELERIRLQHGFALLWEAHTIRSEVPRFFEGRLPDLNLGSSNGQTCHPGITAGMADLISHEGGYTVAVNGRFKGGHITRHFGAPDNGVYAIQLELSQRTYMDEAPPYSYLPERARKVAPLIQNLLNYWLDHQIK